MDNMVTQAACLPSGDTYKVFCQLTAMRQIVEPRLLRMESEIRSIGKASDSLKKTVERIAEQGTLMSMRPEGKTVCDSDDNMRCLRDVESSSNAHHRPIKLAPEFAEQSSARPPGDIDEIENLNMQRQFLSMKAALLQDVDSSINFGLQPISRALEDIKLQLVQPSLDTEHVQRPDKVTVLHDEPHAITPDEQLQQLDLENIQESLREVIREEFRNHEGSVIQQVTELQNSGKLLMNRVAEEQNQDPFFLERSAPNARMSDANDERCPEHDHRVKFAASPGSLSQVNELGCLHASPEIAEVDDVASPKILPSSIELPKKLQAKSTESLDFTRTKAARAAMLALDKSPHMGSKDDGTITVRSRRRLFNDLDEMKHRVRHAVLQPYHVSRYYGHGVCARIANSTQFEMSTMVVIAVNALWIAIDVDINGTKDTKDKDIGFMLIDAFFFIFFSLEILLRFGAFRRKRDCVKDGWFNFDSCLVGLMCVDEILPYFYDGGLGFNTSIIRLVRLIKVSRMGRIAELLKGIPEISVMLQGMGIACRSVASTLFLLVMMVYVFAVLFRYLTIDSDLGRKYFRSVPFGMKTLTISAVMPDADEMIDDAGMEHVLVAILIFVFFVAASLTLLNMLVAMLCEVVNVVAALEQEESRVSMVRHELLQILRASGIDQNVKSLINKGEFLDMLLNVSVAHALRKMGVDPVGLIDVVDYIFSCGDFTDESFQQENGLTFDKLVELICELGGSNTATVKDVVDMRQVVIRHFAHIEYALEQNTARVELAILSAKGNTKSRSTQDFTQCAV